MVIMRITREDSEHHPTHVKRFLIMGLWCKRSRFLSDFVFLFLKCPMQENLCYDKFLSDWQIDV